MKIEKKRKGKFLNHHQAHLVLHPDQIQNLILNQDQDLIVILNRVVILNQDHILIQVILEANLFQKIQRKI